jgi:protein-disulfide isomerase
VLLWIAGVIVAAILFPKHQTTDALAVSPSLAPTAGIDVTPEEQRFDEIWAKQPRIDLGIPADGAKVVIVKFNDWQCPGCKAMHFAYKPILDKYAQSMPGTIKYLIKDFPLNHKCNFANPDARHPAACEAAAAVRLATEKAKGDEMVTWLFANQESLTPPVVTAKVKDMLGIDDFSMQYARLLPAIQRDVSDGAALNFRGTPTYYVNGVKAHGENGAFIAPQYFDYAIRYELRKGQR